MLGKKKVVDFPVHNVTNNNYRYLYLFVFQFLFLLLARLLLIPVCNSLLNFCCFEIEREFFILFYLIIFNYIICIHIEKVVIIISDIMGVGSIRVFIMKLPL